MNKFNRYIFDIALIYRTDFSFIHLFIYALLMSAWSWCYNWQPMMAVQGAKCAPHSRGHMVTEFREEDNQQSTRKLLREGSKQASTKDHSLHFPNRTKDKSGWKPDLT